MDDPSEELGPAAAYSAQVAAWLNQAYHAQLMQYGERAEYFICHLRMTVE